MIFSKDINSWYSLSVNGNIYKNSIKAFTVENLYPTPTLFTAKEQEIVSGTAKWNNTFHITPTFTGQLSANYLAPDIIPQGKTNSRFAMDMGLKKTIQKGKGEVFFNMTDILNSLVIQKEIQGDGFTYANKDYYETQVIRFGYSYKF
ncbi:Outer membrane protein beta-barrel family protein [compost metagenome]